MPQVVELLEGMPIVAGLYTVMVGMKTLVVIPRFVVMPLVVLLPQAEDHGIAAQQHMVMVVAAALILNVPPPVTVVA